MKILLALYLIMLPISGFSQHYTSYFTGNVQDSITMPAGGICLMGGASESDEAMQWFLENCHGGDVLVLRTSGSDGYNNYLYSQLGILVNSVETIVFHNDSAAEDPYVQQKIQQAEGIWMAGGDQWTYVSYWRNTAIDSLINDGLINRNMVIGGTSAGMAIQGQCYFSAQNGTISSSNALANPYHNNVTVDSMAFINNKHLQGVITDTHYDNPDRKGRHITFMARMVNDWGIPAKGIACDEYTAVCIDSTGMAKVYGDYPAYDDNAYFIQSHCEPDIYPETCEVNAPLHWNLDSSAIKVYKVKGNLSGTNTFDLNDWQTGNGGSWENWWVANGSLYQTAGSPKNCETTSFFINEGNHQSVRVYPNPCHTDLLTIESKQEYRKQITITDVHGVKHCSANFFTGTQTLDVSLLPPGVYVVRIATRKKIIHQKLIRN